MSAAARELGMPTASPGEHFVSHASPTPTPEPTQNPRVNYMIYELGLPEDQALDLENNSHISLDLPQSPRTYTRRSAIGLIAGGTAGLVGIGTVGFALLDPEIDIQEHIGPNATLDTSGSMGFVAGSIDQTNLQPSSPTEVIQTKIQGSHVYINLDEFSMRYATADAYGVEVKGTDAIQTYSYSADRDEGTESSGLDFVSTDGIRNLRFAIRPGTGPQFLRSHVSFGEEVIEHSKALTDVFVKHQHMGPIEMYVEPDFVPSGALQTVHQFFNKYSFLFPNNMPFIAIRTTNKDHLIENIPAENHNAIPMELQYSPEDVVGFDDTAAYAALQRIIENLSDNVSSILIGEPYDAYLDFRAAVTQSITSMKGDDFGIVVPNDWPEDVRFTLRNYMFHPKTFSKGLDMTRTESSTNILASLLFIGAHEEHTASLANRIRSLNEVAVTTAIPDANKRAYDMKNILRTAIQTLKGMKGFEEGLPHLNALYDELQLDTLEPPQAITTTNTTSYQYTPAEMAELRK